MPNARMVRTSWTGGRDHSHSKIENICTRREWKAGEISVQRLLLCISPHRRSICTAGSCLQPQAFSSTAQLCADSNAQLCNVLRTFLERHGTVGVRVYTMEREGGRWLHDIYMIGREPEAWLAAWGWATKYVHCTLHIARWLTIMSLVVSMSTSNNLV